jgi:Leucine-rich repeat (LRR) protein
MKQKRKYLNFTNKALKKIDKEFEEYDYDTIIHLDLGRNFLQHLTKNDLCFTSLQVLNLNANDLTEIPILENVPNLIELSLNSNKITFISDQLKFVPKLQILELKKNKIQKITNLHHVKNSLNW